MRRWIGVVAAFYPRSWREEFGEEFSTILDDVKPGWRVFANVLRGAIEMQVTTGTSWIRVTAAAALLGVIVAGGLSFTKAPHYVSSSTISVTPQPDPVRPASPQALHDRAAAHIAQMETEILSRTELSAIINNPRLLLYKEELKRKPLDEVIEEMRSNIRIQAQPAGDAGLAPIVFSISFAYPDQAKAQLAVRALAEKFVELNANINKTGADAYRGFWGDIAARDHRNTAPPPPTGETVGVLSPPSEPIESESFWRLTYLAWGLGAGALLGLLAVFAMRSPRRTWRLAGFAAAGCIIAGAASYLIPNRYTSTAVMQITPAQVTEDPRAPLPNATSATEFLRQMEPEVLSFQSLSRIIEDRRLILYSKERRTKPMEEVVRNMLARDIRIAPVNSASASKGTVSAFSISFSYPDRFKAQQTVALLMNTFDERYMLRRRAEVMEKTLLRHIFMRKAGEALDVLDLPNIPQNADGPNRAAIAAAGFGIGLLLGLVKINFPRHRAPELLPA